MSNLRYEKLLRDITNQDPGTRAIAIQNLYKYWISTKNYSVYRVIKARFRKDPSRLNRAEAAKIMLKIDPFTAVNDIIVNYLDEKNKYTRRDLVTYLGEIENPKIIPFLRDILDVEDDPLIVSEVKRIIRLMQGSASLNRNDSSISLDKNYWVKISFDTIPSDEKCMICKLVIDNEDTIIQCSSCNAIFHKEHLVSWLLKNSNCPVCGNSTNNK